MKLGTRSPTSLDELSRGERDRHVDYVDVGQAARKTFPVYRRTRRPSPHDPAASCGTRTADKPRDEPTAPPSHVRSRVPPSSALSQSWRPACSRPDSRDDRHVHGDLRHPRKLRASSTPSSCFGRHPGQLDIVNDQAEEYDNQSSAIGDVGTGDAAVLTDQRDLLRRRLLSGIRCALHCRIWRRRKRARIAAETLACLLRFTHE